MHTHSSFCTASPPRSRDAPTAAPTDPPRPLTTALGHSLALRAVLHLTQSTPDGCPSPDSGETTTISRVWALVGTFLQNRHREAAPLSWRRSPPEGAPLRLGRGTGAAQGLRPPRVLAGGPRDPETRAPGFPRPPARLAHHWSGCPTRSCSSRSGRSPRWGNSPRCWANPQPRKPWPRPRERSGARLSVAAAAATATPQCSAPPGSPRGSREATRAPAGPVGPAPLGADAGRAILTEGSFPLFPFLLRKGPPSSVRVRRRDGAGRETVWGELRGEGKRESGRESALALAEGLSGRGGRARGWARSGSATSGVENTHRRTLCPPWSRSSRSGSRL